MYGNLFLFTLLNINIKINPLWYNISTNLTNHFFQTKPVVNIKKKKSKSTNYKLPIDRDFEFPRHKLYLGRTIGEGEYGKVVRGKIDGIIRETGLCKLAVKMLKGS